MKEKTKRTVIMTISRLRPSNLNLNPPPLASSFISSEQMRVVVPAKPSEANKATADELLTMVLTVVVTDAIIMDKYFIPMSLICQ